MSAPRCVFEAYLLLASARGLLRAWVRGDRWARGMYSRKLSVDHWG